MTLVTSSHRMDGDLSPNLVRQDFNPAVLVCLHLYKVSRGSVLPPVFHGKLYLKIRKHNVLLKKVLLASNLKFNKSFLITHCFNIFPCLSIYALLLTNLTPVLQDFSNGQETCHSVSRPELPMDFLAGQLAMDRDRKITGF